MSKQEVQKAIQILKDHDFNGAVNKAADAYIAVFDPPQKHRVVYLDNWTIDFDNEKISMSICSYWERSYWERGDVDSETEDVAITVDELFDPDAATKRWQEEREYFLERAKRIKEVEDTLHEARKAKTGLSDLSGSQFIKTDLTEALKNCNELIAKLEEKLTNTRLGFA